MQYYLYYHLGQAYFAKHDYDNAAKWFAKSAESAAFYHDVEARTANSYWEYLSLARGGNLRAAQKVLDDYDLTLFEVQPDGSPDTYFDGLQLFKGHRSPKSFFSAEDTGRAFATADGVAASTAYSLANYYILMGEAEKAKPWLQRSINVDSWSFFARIQAEADLPLGKARGIVSDNAMGPVAAVAPTVLLAAVEVGIAQQHAQLAAFNKSRSPTLGGAKRQCAAGAEQQQACSEQMHRSLGVCQWRRRRISTICGRAPPACTHACQEGIR